MFQMINIMNYSQWFFIIFVCEMTRETLGVTNKITFPPMSSGSAEERPRGVTFQRLILWCADTAPLCSYRGSQRAFKTTVQEPYRAGMPEHS